MRRLLYLFMVLLAFASCKKSEKLNFDERPEIRLQQSIAEINSTLTSATDGWIATLATQAGGGYGFYMTFDKEQKVTMYSDITDEAASKVGTSTYRVKVNLGAELIFDTYNYISILGDPNPSTFGGAEGSGFKSDQEFIFSRSTADSIVFIGKKYGQLLKMVKATSAQKTIYEAAGYKTAIDKTIGYFTDTPNPYIEIGSGSSIIKAGITLNSSNDMYSGKRVDFTGVLADGKTVSSSNSKFAFVLDGANMLDSGLVFQGTTFVKIAWKDATTLAIYDAAGKEYLVKSSPTPLVPLFQLWGSKYNGMLSEFKTIYPGTSAKGAEILNFFHNNLTNAYTGYFFNYGRINFAWNTVNKRFAVVGHTSQSNGANTWGTITTYSYTVSETGVYAFTEIAPAEGGYAAKIVTKINDFLKSNRVTFDYYIDGANTYGKMTSVDDPTIVMTFELR
jgi:hypothetical protein